MRRVALLLFVGLAVPVDEGIAQREAVERPVPLFGASVAPVADSAARAPARVPARRPGATLLAGTSKGVIATSAGAPSETSPAAIPSTLSPVATDLTALIEPLASVAGRAPLVARQSARRVDQSWWPPVASAILPGAGQALLRQDRALAFLAVESYGWLRYASDVREGRRQRNAYRALAARVARAYLSDDNPVGDFEYYERMEHYIESGVFDTSPDEGVQPEVNPESFNGFIWLRARTTFWEDPAIPPPPTSEAYFAALEYYADRAIQPEFRWSWRNAQLEQDLFRRTIGRSNDAFRRSIQDLGVIIANHALSTVDAYVTVRIRSARAASGSSGVGIEASLPWSPRLPLVRREEHPR